MEREPQPRQENQESQEEKLEQLIQKTGVELEIISGVPVFTIQTDQKDEAKAENKKPPDTVGGLSRVPLLKRFNLSPCFFEWKELH